MRIAAEFAISMDPPTACTMRKPMSHRAQRARVAGLLAALPEQDVQALSEAMSTALPIVRRMLHGESAS